MNILYVYNNFEFNKNWITHKISNEIIQVLSSLNNKIDFLIPTCKH